MNVWSSLRAGMAAGAAGTTALNAVTYLDMAARGRPASTVPEDAVRDLSDRSGVTIPGDDEARENRQTGLGALLGISTGVGIGAVLGMSRAFGLRPPAPATALIAGVGAMVGTDASMVALGITDPRSWKATDWLADVAPHLAYGAVTAAVLHGLERR
ncbi:hypothetical protein E0H75_40525 [Kribbella capetownensis]|uniref:DUF1440 domain-containing protein n=1 Tax=Kribbella capetownensis TaxID=1572659 RepID=A0A4R0J7R4_9ACTN|nr:hypothetical protein [Kribbella capetownensis]TCC37435.1 hypothetical protein E0H75_40525 [Kribbella capetownensis]